MPSVREGGRRGRRGVDGGGHQGVQDFRAGSCVLSRTLRQAPVRVGNGARPGQATGHKRQARRQRWLGGEGKRLSLQEAAEIGVNRGESTLATEAAEFLVVALEPVDDRGWLLEAAGSPWWSQARGGGQGPAEYDTEGPCEGRTRPWAPCCCHPTLAQGAARCC